MATNRTPQIVNLNTSVTAAPQPITVQQTGAIPSTGGTTLTTNAKQYCATLAQVTAILAAPLPLASLSWAAGTVTATTAAAIGLATGETFTVVIAGAAPAGFNGTYVATVTGAETFTYAIASNPGTETAPGTYTPPDAGFLIDTATTWFAQGNQVGITVVELGAQASNAAAITALQTWITNYDNPQAIYSWLTPGSWDVDQSAALNTLAGNYSSATGCRYFFVTTTQAHLSAYTSKAVFAVVPSPTQAVAEHQAAAFMYQWNVNNPGPANQLAPMSFRFLLGITPWSQSGNSAAINSILSANGNLALVAAEGGLSNIALYDGMTMDGNQASAWYGIDWVQLQAKQALAAAVINGSNQQPPLLYDQHGINTLQQVAQRIANNAVAYGCANTAVVSAVPFSTYIAQNPNDYGNGIYNGLSCTMTAQNGFLSITFNLAAVQL